MSDQSDQLNDDLESAPRGGRRVRADAQRNLEALLQAAKTVFASSGVDAPVREIADQAGVGIATIYRHFPQRADLIAGVFRHEIDVCADAAQSLSERHQPGKALDMWMQQYGAFVATKRGLAPALHSGDPAYENLRPHFEKRVRPALRSLVEDAIAVGDIRDDVDADDLLGAVSSLCMSVDTAKPGRAERMISLLFDGLRYGAKT